MKQDDLVIRLDLTKQPDMQRYEIIKEIMKVNNQKTLEDFTLYLYAYNKRADLKEKQEEFKDKRI